MGLVVISRCEGVSLVVQQPKAVARKKKKHSVLSLPNAMYVVCCAACLCSGKGANSRAYSIMHVVHCFQIRRHFDPNRTFLSCAKRKKALLGSKRLADLETVYQEFAPLPYRM